jgi:hypothetical protein
VRQLQGWQLLPAGAFAGWDSHPLESAALSRRTPNSDIGISVDSKSDVVIEKETGRFSITSVISPSPPEYQALTHVSVDRNRH